MNYLRFLAIAMLGAVTCQAQPQIAPPLPTTPLPTQAVQEPVAPSSPMVPPRALRMPPGTSQFPPPPIQPGSPPLVVTKEAVNYVIRVQCKDAKGKNSSLQVLTIEGSFNLDTIQPSTMKINDSEIPTTLKFHGELTVLSPEKGRLKLFLGRTVPYVTGSYGGGSRGKTASSYQQLQVGLDSAFVVTFGKPLVIQADESGEVTILVKREEN
jgi:hypothetical protein